MINQQQQYNQNHSTASPYLPPPPQHNTVAQTPPRPIDNRPAWLTEVRIPGSAKRVDFDLKDEQLEEEPDHKHGRLYVVTAGIFVSKNGTNSRDSSNATGLR